METINTTIEDVYESFYERPRWVFESEVSESHNFGESMTEYLCDVIELAVDDQLYRKERKEVSAIIEALGPPFGTRDG